MIPMNGSAIAAKEHQEVSDHSNTHSAAVAGFHIHRALSIPQRASNRDKAPATTVIRGLTMAGIKQ